MQGCLHLPDTPTHYDLGEQPRSQASNLLSRDDNRRVWKTLLAQHRTNAQLNSHMALAVNQTGVTLVRGERFTMNPISLHCCLPWHFVYGSLLKTMGGMNVDKTNSKIIGKGYMLAKPVVSLTTIPDNIIYLGNTIRHQSHNPSTQSFQHKLCML